MFKYINGCGGQALECLRAPTTSSPMSVRAKMRCTAVKKEEHESNNRYVELMAVSDNEGSNKSWSEWTPMGQVMLTISNPAAHCQFEVGKSYYVDFNEVDEKA